MLNIKVNEKRFWVNEIELNKFFETKFEPNSK